MWNYTLAVCFQIRAIIGLGFSRLGFSEHIVTLLVFVRFGLGLAQFFCAAGFLAILPLDLCCAIFALLFREPSCLKLKGLMFSMTESFG